MFSPLPYESAARAWLRAFSAEHVRSVKREHALEARRDTRCSCSRKTGPSGRCSSTVRLWWEIEQPERLSPRDRSWKGCLHKIGRSDRPILGLGPKWHKGHAPAVAARVGAAFSMRPWMPPAEGFMGMPPSVWITSAPARSSSMARATCAPGPLSASAKTCTHRGEGGCYAGTPCALVGE